MKKISFSIVLTILFFGCLSAQEINQTNEKGERIGVWKKYHQNKRIRYEGQFENGKEVGVFKFYAVASSDFPVVIKTFNNVNGKAEVQFFTEKGVLESEGDMHGKDRIGKWLYYLHDGKTIILEENYIDGKLSGENKIFYKNGKLTELSHYKEGKLHGNSKRYSDEGKLMGDLNYVNGELGGEAIFYDTNGQVKRKGQYEADLKVGVWEFYTDGVLTKSEEVKTLLNKD